MKNKIKLENVILLTIFGGYICFVVYNVIF